MMYSRVIARTSIQPSFFNKLHCKLCSTNTKQTTEAQISTENILSTTKELYGQPTAITHPHLMKDGELVPGISLSEFKNRRCKLMESLTMTTPQNTQHLAVIPSATKMYMTEKIPYVFRQNSDFLYLTGCQEPDSVLVMLGTNVDDYTSTIFVRKRDAHSELWDGPRTGVERAPSLFGVQQALPMSELKAFLSPFVKKESNNFILWYDHASCVHPEIKSIMKMLFKGNEENEYIWESPRMFLHKQRLIKSSSEQHLMRESCKIASKAISRAMAVSKPGITEHQLFATVDYESRMRGAEILAYPPVVAAGNNATIIHYINNTQTTQPGDMILMDAGCEYHSYVSDITRTWPVDGKFTEPQRVLYEVVLSVQLELIKQTQNLPSLDNLFHYMCRLLGMKLREAGVIPSSISTQKLAQVAYEFCPHHVSHYLGMDVHDTAAISRSIPLQHGMVVTVEPGVYVMQNNKNARPEFRGMGIRIEDDVLILEKGPEVLSAQCPKEISEVEEITGSAVYT